MPSVIISSLVGSSKARATTLITKIVTLKYSGSSSYPEWFRGFRFYNPSHTIRTVETKDAIFLEDAKYIGSNTPRMINLEKIQDHASILVIQKVSAPLPYIKDNDAPEVVYNDTPEVVYNDTPPAIDHALILTNEQPFRRSGREIRTATSDDFVYLDEAEYNLGNFLIGTYLSIAWSSSASLSRIFIKNFWRFPRYIKAKLIPS
ncbi:hypothetical protein RJ639_034777 [Escallonia herrerae]|uniref:Uncharacterized protein n=1 Tax=Escallonia herrerae TaxID=1293975 RepID=A0AA88WXD9_9ASTE|nr:hypothetical protein RJ639_034777 [Escallonia herrerae]